MNGFARRAEYGGSGHPACEFGILEAYGSSNIHPAGS